MPTVLVVDDQPDVASLLSAIVQFAGGQAVVVSNGVAALTALDRHAFDLVLLDQHMPGMSGLDVLRTLRERDEPMPYAVVCSASDDACETAMTLGAKAFVLKTETNRLMAIITARLAA